MSLLITTSWDDGYALDMQVAEILDVSGLKGTFYVCPKPQHGLAMLSSDDIRALAQHHEIGSHTVNHPKLTEISDDDVRRELADSKKWIEDVSGKPCTSFCYPKGAHDERVRRLTKEAGYAAARTCDMLRFDATDRHALPVSIQLFPFPWRRSFSPAWKILDPLGPLRVKVRRLSALGIPWSKRGSWRHMADALLEKAVREKLPFFHLYGHSKELDQFGLWDEFRSFAKALSSIQDAKHVTNAELSASLRLP